MPHVYPTCQCSPQYDSYHWMALVTQSLSWECRCLVGQIRHYGVFIDDCLDQHESSRLEQRLVTHLQLLHCLIQQQSWGGYGTGTITVGDTWFLSQDLPHSWRKWWHRKWQENQEPNLFHFFIPDVVGLWGHVTRDRPATPWCRPCEKPLPILLVLLFIIEIAMRQKNIGHSLSLVGYSQTG